MRTFLPSDHPDAPKFWANEISGVLEPVIRAYLQDNQLTPDQVEIMRLYLAQWVNSPAWSTRSELDILRLRVAAAHTLEEIEACIDAAVDLGMDPL